MARRVLARGAEGIREPGPPGVAGQRGRVLSAGVGRVRRAAAPAPVVAAVAAVLLATAVAVGRPFATAAHGWHRPALAVDLTFLADVPLPAATLVLAVAAAGALAGWRPGPAGRMVLAAAVATFVAVGLKDELKFAVGRPWPETWVDDNPSWIRDHVFGLHPFHGGRGYASFPSGHATAISAPSAVLWRALPRWRALAAALVAAVAAGLLASDYHFVSDVLAGTYLGAAVGLSVAALMAG